MADIWRIFVVEHDETLNRNVVSFLRKDGYTVRGVTNGAEAVRVLWSEEYDVVICDLKMPGVDGLELLQWLRGYRPSSRTIVIGEANSAALRLQAFECGAVGYLEKPLDLRLLKEELHRLLQQTGFSASLDSFDLLDVIQIINMSRKSIMLLINTGLEERGMLLFQNGELVWAEYGILRGEEAFFALAAHKNGTVTQHPWDEQIRTNVTQPLSRLIFQALQYRTKYADRLQYTGEQRALGAINSALPTTRTTSASGIQVNGSELDVDDRPFILTPDELGQGGPVDGAVAMQPQTGMDSAAGPASTKEWWERTGKTSSVRRQGDSAGSSSSDVAESSAFPLDLQPFAGIHSTNTQVSQSEQNTSEEHAGIEYPLELPSWLTKQATSPTPALSSLQPQLGEQPNAPGVSSSPTPFPPTGPDSMYMPAVSATPVTPIVPTPKEWSSDWPAALPRGMASEQVEPARGQEAAPFSPPQEVSPEWQGNSGFQVQQGQGPASSPEWAKLFSSQGDVRGASSPEWGPSPSRSSPPSSPEWGISQPQQPFSSPSQPLQQTMPMAPIQSTRPVPRIQAASPASGETPRVLSGMFPETSAPALSSTENTESVQESSPLAPSSVLRAQRLAARRNYAALVSALQTLGYSIAGFIAAAVVSLDGQAIAQVAIDDMDITKLCKQASTIQKTILQSLQPDEWGEHQEVAMTTATRHVLLRLVGAEKKAFLALITTHETSLAECLEIMTNVAGAISAALR